MVVIVTSSQKKAISTILVVSTEVDQKSSFAFTHPIAWKTHEISGFQLCTHNFHDVACHHETAYDSRDQLVTGKPCHTDYIYDQAWMLAGSILRDISESSVPSQDRVLPSSTNDSTTPSLVTCCRYWVPHADDWVVEWASP